MAHQSTAEAWLTWMFSPTISAILVTLLVSLLSPILIHIYLYRKSKSAELPSFLLLGPSGSGKTSLLTLFATGHPSTTHTSQSPISAPCHLPSSTVSSSNRFRSEHDSHIADEETPQFLLLDTPGHFKLRHHAFSLLSSPPPSLKGIIFLLDSAALSSSPSALTDSAEYLHDVLLSLQKSRTKSKSSKGPGTIPVLIAANKQDVFTSLPPELVRKRLEEEVGRVRGSRSKGLKDSGEGGEEEEEENWLGEFGQGEGEFGFGEMEGFGIEIAVEGGNVRGQLQEGQEGEEGEGEGEVRVEGWWSWVGGNL